MSDKLSFLLALTEFLAWTLPDAVDGSWKRSWRAYQGEEEREMALEAEEEWETEREMKWESQRRKRNGKWQGNQYVANFRRSSKIWQHPSAAVGKSFDEI